MGVTPLKVQSVSNSSSSFAVAIAAKFSTDSFIFNFGDTQGVTHHEPITTTKTEFTVSKVTPVTPTITYDGVTIATWRWLSGTNIIALELDYIAITSNNVPYMAIARPSNYQEISILTSLPGGSVGIVVNHDGTTVPVVSS